MCGGQRIHRGDNEESISDEEFDDNHDSELEADTASEEDGRAWRRIGSSSRSKAVISTMLQVMAGLC